MWLEPEQEDQNKPSAPTSPSVGAGGGTTGTGGTTANTSTQNPVQSNQPQQQFATVQDYLGANQPQAEKLGQDFSSNLNQSAVNEKNAIDTATAGTKNDITAGTVNYDPNLTTTALSNPTVVTNNPDQLGSFLKQWNAAYSGPQSFETSNEYGTAAGAANEAATKQAESKTAGGQQQLLQDQFGVYGQGNKGLDQALLQNSSAYPTVNTGQQFQNVQDYLASQANDVNSQATAANAATQAAKTNTQNAFTNNLSNFQNDLNTRVAAARNNATAQLEGTQNQTLAPNLDILKNEYGITPDLSGQKTFNANTTITPSNIATPEDYAKATAYQQLTGTDYSGVLNPANAGQAGTGTNVDTGAAIAPLQQYLQNQIKQKDTERLATTNIADLSKGMNLANITDPAHQNDVALGQQTAQGLISVAQRNGMGRGQNGVANNLDNLYHEAAVALVGYQNAGGGRQITDPHVAGLNTFVNTLGTYLYGSPQYAVYNQGGK